MKIKTKEIFTITRLIGLFCLINQATTISADNTGASFLKIGIGARPIGMGSAYTAISDDVQAIQWNPGGLAQLNKKEITAMHSEWFVDTKLEYIGYAFPFKFGVIGGSVIYLSQSEIDSRDENRQKTGVFSADDLAITISYSRQLSVSSKQGSIGLNLKFIQQQIESHQATGIAFDFGSLYRFTTLPLTAGFSIQNLGSQMKFISKSYNLPLTIIIGLGYNISLLTLAFDIKQENSMKIRQQYVLEQNISQ